MDIDKKVIILEDNSARFAPPQRVYIVAKKIILSNLDNKEEGNKYLGFRLLELVDTWNHFVNSGWLVN